MIGRLIGGMMVVVVGFSFYKPISEQIKILTANVTSSGATTILTMTPLFFAMGVLAAGAAIIIGSFRSNGLLGEGEDVNEEEYIVEEIDDQKIPSHKQTYKEYVKERIEVEKMVN
jgi:hypothetical protein